MKTPNISLARVLAILALLCWVAILSPYPTTVFMAGAVACLTLPVYRYLRARMGRFPSVCVYAAGLSTCIILPFTVVSVLVAPQAVEGVKSLMRWRESGWTLSPEMRAHIDDIQELLSRIPGFDDWAAEISENFTNLTNEFLRNIVSGGIGVAGSTAAAGFMVFLFITLSTLAVVYAPTLAKLTIRVTQLPEAALKRFVLAMRSAVRAVFIGIIFVAIIQGTLCGIGFKIFGVQNPAFWGLIAVFAGIIPIVGTALIWVPMVGMMWFNGYLWAGIGITGWGIFIVAGSDNIIRPYLLKTGIEAPIFVLLLSILCSIVVFGPVGLVAGPLLVAFGIQAMKESDIQSKKN